MNAQQPLLQEFQAMGTFAFLSVPAAEKARLNDCATSARGLMQELENQLSVFRPESEISLIAMSAGKQPVQVSPSTYHVLCLAQEYAVLSDGAFDVTMAPLMSLWGFARPSPGNGMVSGKVSGPVKPSRRTIESALEYVGFSHLILSNSTAYLEKTGMQVDLGGIAKGYTVDLCYDELVSAGADNLLVNLGGNIRCCGFSRRNVAWQVGVRDPFDSEHTSIIGTLKLTGGMATATSGSYERFIEIDDKRYAHIIDPRTGYPVEGMASVTVVCPTATEADALSTTLFVLGMDEGARVLAERTNCAALFIPDTPNKTGSAELWMTRSFGKYFKPLPHVAGRITVLD